MENIEQGNRLIAAFIGGIEHPENFWWKIAQKKNGSVSSDKLQYHTSWDWIMPVVEKIGSLNYEFDINTHYGIEVSSFPMQSIFALDDEEYLSKPLIEQVWLAVIEFITWYNQNNKQ